MVLLPRSPSPSKRYFPIPLDSLEEEYRIRSADDGKLFREEFNVSLCCVDYAAQSNKDLCPESTEQVESIVIKCYVSRLCAGVFIPIS